MKKFIFPLVVAVSASTQILKQGNLVHPHFEDDAIDVSDMLGTWHNHPNSTYFYWYTISMEDHKYYITSIRWELHDFWFVHELLLENRFNLRIRTINFLDGIDYFVMVHPFRGTGLIRASG